MTRGLLVEEAGLFSTVQDLGRQGFQSLGVPPSGALDPVSLRLANLVVGNPPGCAALEMCRLGATLRVTVASLRIALAGAPSVGGLPVLRSLTLREGDVLRVGRVAGGATYLTVEGGFDLKPVLGSLSTYARARIGGFGGRRLEPGDVLPLVRQSATVRRERALPTPFPPSVTGRCAWSSAPRRITSPRKPSTRFWVKASP